MEEDVSEGIGYLILSVLAALYIISPIDLLPDFIPVIGQLDDIVVGMAGIASALQAIVRMLPLFLVLGLIMLVVMIVR
jgi:uncharacterized membrane protein YkvA (DUF1232 family)